MSKRLKEAFVQPDIKAYGQRNLADFRQMSFLLRWIRYWMDLVQLPCETYTADQAAGTHPKNGRKLGPSTDVIVGIGAFDAHMGAVGGQIEPYYLSKVMGTSTCDMLVVPVEEFGDKLVRGICGQVHGSVIPGMIGLEAGQSAFGDIYAWFKNLLAWPQIFR